MYYKTWQKRLENTGWKVTEEHDGLYYEVRWDHPGNTAEESARLNIRIVCDYAKSGKPGKIRWMFQGGKLCHI